MKSDDRWLSMSRISTPFMPEEPIKISTSIHHSTPVRDQVSTEKWFEVKAPPIRNFALPLAIKSSRARKQSMTRIRTNAEGHIKTKNHNLVKSLST